MGINFTMAFRRAFSNTLAAQSKVCVGGGAGGIGQPLSLLLKQNSLVSHVAVFDMVGAPGVAADLSHINTPPKLRCRGDPCWRASQARYDSPGFVRSERFVEQELRPSRRQHLRCRGRWSRRERDEHPRCRRPCRRFHPPTFEPLHTRILSKLSTEQVEALTHRI